MMQLMNNENKAIMKLFKAYLSEESVDKNSNLADKASFLENY